MTTPRFDFASRLDRARREMDRADLDSLLLSVGPDLPYLTGYEAMPLERLTMFALTQEGAVLVVPRLEEPRVEPGPFEVRAWGETEDPVAIVADSVGPRTRLGIGDHTWSVFLLRLQEMLEGSEFVSATPVMSSLRIRKEAAEIDLLRRAAHATDRVAARLATTQMSGLTERELSRRVGEWTVDEGHDIATFRIVAAGPNGASPHHEPTERVIGEGDMVVIDFGGRLDGYCSDMTRMFVVGEPTREQAEVHEVVRVAQQAAVEVVHPGLDAAAIDRAARQVIDDAGYGDYFIHRCGHGIGLEGHEEPYLVESNHRPVESGMVFSVEPGIYLPDRFGVRIEDIVAVTDDGVEALNQASHELTVVE